MVKLHLFKNANTQKNKRKRKENEKAEKKGRMLERKEKARQKFCFLISLLKSVR